MATKQPEWKLVANLGDVNPLDYGGFFVYVDTTGEYEPEAELLQVPDDEDSDEPYTVHRFTLDKLKIVEDPETHTVYLVTDRYADDWPHPLHMYDEWFHEDLAGVAAFMGSDLADLRAAFCSEDPIERADAYRAIGDYHGFDNLDSYPLTLNRAEVEERYKDLE